MSRNIDQGGLNYKKSAKTHVAKLNEFGDHITRKMKI
jgi:hypothetical protein